MKWTTMLLDDNINDNMFDILRISFWPLPSNYFHVVKRAFSDAGWALFIIQQGCLATR